MSHENRSSINLGIVCPMANERDTAEPFVKDVLDYCQGYKSVKMFVVLDNCSKDGTVDLIKRMEQKEPRLKLVWAPENRCVVDAYMRGYREALSAQCDWILEIDAGYSHQPTDIPQFFSKVGYGYDCVFGSRFCKGGSYEGAPWTRFMISRVGSQLINLFLGTRLSDMTSGFEFFTARALSHALDKGVYSRGHFFQSEIKVHCRRFNVAEVPIHYKNPSNSISNKVLVDAFQNLGRLISKRIQGKL